MGKAAIDQHLTQVNALRGKNAQQQIMRPLEVGFGKTVRAQPILITDHHDFIARRHAARQRGDDARQQREFGEMINLEILRLLDQATIAIDEKDLALNHAAASP